MKKILLSLIMLAGLCALAVADFNTYNVAVTTYPITGVDTTPNITGNIRIGKVIISNSDDTTAQVVTMYKLGDSSTTVTAELVTDFGAGDTNDVVVYEWQQSDMWAVHDFLVRKSTTASTVNITVQYR